MEHRRSLLHEVTLHDLLMLSPQSGRLDKAIIVRLSVVEEENVKLVGGLETNLILILDALDGYVIFCLSDISFQVVIVQTLACQSELCETAARDLL